MKHLTAILIKFVMIAVVLEIVLNILTDLSFGNILLISAAVTVIAYVIGDLMVLPASNNTTATIGDFGLALITIYLFNYFIRGAEISIWDAGIAALALAAGEWFFHKFVPRVSLEKSK